MLNLTAITAVFRLFFVDEVNLGLVESRNGLEIRVPEYLGLAQAKNYLNCRPFWHLGSKKTRKKNVLSRI